MVSSCTFPPILLLLITATTRFVMQDTKDPRAFTIVERYANEGSQKYNESLVIILLRTAAN